MQLLIDLEEDGPVTPEVVRENVERAILDWKNKSGLSDENDEGMINLIEVTIIKE